MCYNEFKTKQSYIVGFIGDEDFSAPIPEKPVIYCYVCNKEIKNAMFSLSWSDDAYRVEGTCCGRAFKVLIKWQDIRDGKVPTYVANLS